MALLVCLRLSVVLDLINYTYSIVDYFQGINLKFVSKI